MTRGTKVREVWSGRIARIVRRVVFVTPYDIHVFYVVEYRDGYRGTMHADGIERVA